MHKKKIIYENFGWSFRKSMLQNSRILQKKHIKELLFEIFPLKNNTEKLKSKA